MKKSIVITLAFFILITLFTHFCEAQEDLVITQLTGGQTWALYPALSEDGTKIVFYRWTGRWDSTNGSGDIYLYDVTLSQETQLTHLNFRWLDDVSALKISGNKVIWVDKRSGVREANFFPRAPDTHRYSSDIYALDITAPSEVTRLSEDFEIYDMSPLWDGTNVLAAEPDIENDKVVYKATDGRHGLFLVDLNRPDGERKILITQDVREPEDAQCTVFVNKLCLGQIRTYNYTPVINENRIFWLRKVETVVQVGNGLIPNIEIFWGLYSYDPTSEEISEVKRWTEQELIDQYDMETMYAQEGSPGGPGWYVNVRNELSGRYDDIRSINVSGDKVLLQIYRRATDEQRGQRDVYLLDSASGDEQLLFTVQEIHTEKQFRSRFLLESTPLKISRPSLVPYFVGSRIIYHNDPGTNFNNAASRTHVFTYDIDRGVTQITSNPRHHFFPVAGGNKIVWIESDNDENDFANANWHLFLAGPSEEVEFRRGDSNADRNINLTDAVFSLNYLFLAGPMPTCFDAVDADDSGAINLTDAVFTLNYLFRAGPWPPDPGPDERGPDPTADRINCEDYPLQ